MKALVLFLTMLVLPAAAGEKLRVFSLNIWQEGTMVPDGFDQVVEIIIKSDADVVTLSEVRNYEGRDLHQRLLEALAAKGHTCHGIFAGGDVGLISRFPVTETAPIPSPKNTSIHAFHLRLPDGAPLLVAVAHLEYTNYAVYLPRGYDGNSFNPLNADGSVNPDKNADPHPVTDGERILAMDANSSRDEAIAAFLTYAGKFPDADIVLAGDFNEASHLDWIEANADKYDRNGVHIVWRNSKTLADNGFVDSYREIHPDPLTHPGFTWPSANSGHKVINWTPKADDRERIDFIYYNRRHLKATASHLVGPKLYYLKGKLVDPQGSQDSFLLEKEKWPSDHKGVITDFERVAGR